MTRLRFICMGIGLAGIIVLGSCTTQPPRAESGPASRELQAPLDTRETAIQSRTFAAGKPIVFRSVISVIEDLGYAVHEADPKSGLITAEGAVEGSASSGILRKAVVTALVEQAGADVRVILNFAIRSQYSGASSRAAPETISVFETGLADDSYSFSFTTTTPSQSHPRWYEEPVLETDVYRNAFDHIEQAVLRQS